MSVLCDLHTHTAASDGQHTPAELVRGVRFGPERLPMPEGFDELAEDWWNGHITATDAGRRLGISRKTFTRRAEEWRQAAGLKRRKTT